MNQYKKRSNRQGQPYRNDLIEDESFGQNIRRGLEKIRDAGSRSSSFILNLDSGEMESFKIGVRVHKTELEKKSWGWGDSLCGAVLKTKDNDIIFFELPPIDSNSDQDKQNLRKRVMKVLDEVVQFGFEKSTIIKVGNSPRKHVEKYSPTPMDILPEFANGNSALFSPQTYREKK